MPLPHGNGRAQTSTAFWKFEARILNGFLDLNPLQTGTSNAHSPPAICMSRACKICPRSAAEQPKHWWCSWVQDLIPSFQQAGAQRPSPGGPPVTPWTLLRPRSDLDGWWGGGRTLRSMKATIPVTLLWWGSTDSRAWEAGRKEEGPAGAGPASGSSGSSGQGLQQAPRHERQRSSTAGPSTQLSSLSELTWLTAGRVGFWKTPPQGDQSRVVGISSAGCLVQGWKSKWEAGAHYLSCCIPRLSSIIKKLAVGTYLHLQMLTDPGGGRLPCQKWEGSWVPHDGFVLLTSGVFFSFKKYSSKNGCLKMPQPIQLITRFYRRQ